MDHPTAHVPLPDVAFEDGTPVSVAFGDVYFSRKGGMAETEHVFLAGNGLPEHWRGRENFSIAELGFGTGLNFLVALKRFRETADAGAQLHYIAIEQFPLTVQMLSQALALQPELAAEAAELLANYPLRLPGIHRIHLPRATLTLAYGEAAAMLEELELESRSPKGEPEGQGSSKANLINAWFLDGFAPAKNPEMWRAEVLEQIGRLSAPDATFATFTAAGAVRRGLEAQGFAVRKVAGYGHKRDMLVGQRAAYVAPECAKEARPNVTILGAGIAGATLARALAERGFAVTVLERGDVASGASGNTAGVLFPPLPKRWTPAAAWYFTAYGLMLRQLARWRAAGLVFDHAAPGMLRLPRHAQEEAQLQGLHASLGLDPAIVHWVTREEASRRAGVELTTGGAWFAQGSWLSPPTLIAALLAHPNITLHTQQAATRLSREGGAWVVETATGARHTAPICCIATAYDATALLPDAHGIKLHAVAGQVSRIGAQQVAAPLTTILCHKGYVIPTGDAYLIGATYNHDDTTGAVRQENHQKNLADVENFLPGWVRGTAVGGRTSLRATTPDRLPYVGAVGEGLFLSAGHGSRGLLSAPLAAEAIASMIAGEVVPLTMGLRKAVDPRRLKESA